MFNIDTDTVTKEENGEWGTYEGSEFLIASIQSIRFQKIFSQLKTKAERERGRSRRRQEEDLDPEVQLEVLCKAASQALILDWRKVTNNKEEDVMFTVQGTYEALKRNSGFRQWVQDFAMDVGNYQDEVIQEAGKSQNATLQV